MSLRIVLASMALGLTLVACRGANEQPESPPLPPDRANDADVAALREHEYFGLANFIEALRAVGVVIEYGGPDRLYALVCDDLWPVATELVLTSPDGASSHVTLIEYPSIASVARQWTSEDEQLVPIRGRACTGGRYLNLLHSSGAQHRDLVLAFWKQGSQPDAHSDDFDAALAALLATVETDR